ncbi:MAG TPA: AbrB/MazE/SpoVT family DNA-binding domain-containing protein [Burkholderiaceae bacterium]
MARTTVFQSGNSQAVRLPKAFRFKSATVEIFRRGDEVVLRERARTLGEALAALPPLDPSDAEVLDLIRESRPAEERDWSALHGGTAVRRPRRGP